MYVKNAVVSDNMWEVEGFIETKKGGFIAAIHEYDKGDSVVPVVFMNRKAFVVFDNEEERLSTMEEIKVALKQCYDSGQEFESVLEDQEAFVLCTDLDIVNDYVKEEYGITDEDIEDMENRIMDLDGYEEEVYLDPDN